MRGSLIVETSSRKRGRVPEYVCYRHRANGACPNSFRIAVTELNEAVLQAAEQHALTPEAIDQVIQLSEREDVAELQATLMREQKDVAPPAVVPRSHAANVVNTSVGLRDEEMPVLRGRDSGRGDQVQVLRERARSTCGCKVHALLTVLS